MNTFLVAYFSRQYISLDTCVRQQLVVGRVRPQPLPGHFTFQLHSSSPPVTFYTLHILTLYSTLRSHLGFNICTLVSQQAYSGRFEFKGLLVSKGPKSSLKVLETPVSELNGQCPFQIIFLRWMLSLSE